MILPYRDKMPKVAKDVFVAEGAKIIGDVEIGKGSSVWFNAVLRGDVFWVKVGKKTSIQDLSVLHVTKDTYPCVVGDCVTVGHRAILHGCKVGDYCLVGMGAIILDDAEIGERCIVGAGSVVAPGTKVPPRSLALGVPAKVKRELTAQELEMLEESAESYYTLSREYLVQGDGR